MAPSVMPGRALTPGRRASRALRGALRATAPGSTLRSVAQAAAGSHEPRIARTLSHIDVVLVIPRAHQASPNAGNVRARPACVAGRASLAVRSVAMASDDAAADAALQLMRRLPPEHVVANLGTVLGARPELTEELLSRVDQPLQVATDDVTGRDFLLCDYNRDADSYRCAPRLRLCRRARCGRLRRR